MPRKPSPVPRQCKYIIFPGCIPVVFPDACEHSVIAGGRRVESAGFCMVYSARGRLVVSCFGESRGLKATNRGAEDAAQIELMFSESHAPAAKPARTQTGNVTTDIAVWIRVIAASQRRPK